MARRVGGHRGGIVWALGVLEAHRGALQYDLMTRTPYTLADLGASLTWDALAAFLRHLPPESEVRAEIDPDGAAAAWWLARAPAAVMADLYDLTANLGRRRGSRPVRYPRPWDRSRTETLGRDPVPMSDFDDWWDTHGV